MCVFTCKLQPGPASDCGVPQAQARVSGAWVGSVRVSGWTSQRVGDLSEGKGLVRDTRRTEGLGWCLRTHKHLCAFGPWKCMCVLALVTIPLCQPTKRRGFVCAYVSVSVSLCASVRVCLRDMCSVTLLIEPVK